MAQGNPPTQAPAVQWPIGAITTQGHRVGELLRIDLLDLFFLLYLGGQCQIDRDALLR